MVLTHVEREPGERRGQRALSQERIRSGRPQPLPGPGVFATHDSVATPALLPDGWRRARRASSEPAGRTSRGAGRARAASGRTAALQPA